jgi:chaperone BCS1
MNNQTAHAGASTRAMPTSIPGLIALLFSFSALRDWLKLIVIGSVIEYARRFAFSTWRTLVESFFITATFEEDDESYDWMMVWLSKKTTWCNARDLQISTRSFGLNQNAVLVPGEEETSSSALAGSRKLAYLPSTSSSHSLWYKGRRMTISRSQAENGYYRRREDLLHISILTRSHSFLNDILLEAKREYMTAKEDLISIYVQDPRNDWKQICSRPKRSLNSIVLDPGVKELLIEDAKDFLASKSWYSDRGIPFRRGYLLYGPPGAGKTSIIHSMAGELGLDVYVISLSRSGLDDTALNELVSELPEKCIALMEDIDAAFHHGVTREVPEVPDTGDENNRDGGSSPMSHNPAAPPQPSSRITLSGLLNALDGVGAQEGRILFATTNKYGSLDPALCRPGRMDLHVEFHQASRFQCLELFRRFYNPVDTEDLESDSETDDSESDGGDSTPTCLSTPEEKSKKQPSVPTTHRHGSTSPKLRPSQIKSLANRFSEAIPEREFSMASLQGYLMTYKTRPFNAVADVGEWVKQELAGRSVKAGAKDSGEPAAAI